MIGERFYIKDLKSGKTYLVEAIGKYRTGFGDSLDSRCNGSIQEKDSWIKDGVYAKSPEEGIAILERRKNSAR